MKHLATFPLNQPTGTGFFYRGLWLFSFLKHINSKEAVLLVRFFYLWVFHCVFNTWEVHPERDFFRNLSWGTYFWRYFCLHSPCTVLDSSAFPFCASLWTVPGNSCCRARREIWGVQYLPFPLCVALPLVLILICPLHCVHFLFASTRFISFFVSYLGG